MAGRKEGKRNGGWRNGLNGTKARMKIKWAKIIKKYIYILEYENEGTKEKKKK